MAFITLASESWLRFGNRVAPPPNVDWASVEHGMWYARSAEFMQTPLMDTLRWMRVIGDTIFAVGVVVLGYFVLGLKTG
jgi:nitric oxide reductase large subunit